MNLDDFGFISAILSPIPRQVSCCWQHVYTSKAWSLTWIDNIDTACLRHAKNNRKKGGSGLLSMGRWVKMIDFRYQKHQNQIRLTIIKLTIIIQECQEKSERVSAYLDISEIWLTINGIQEILRVSTSHASSTLRIISEIYHVWTINCINSNSLGSRVAIINSTILSTSPFTMFAHSPNGYWCPSAHAGRPAAIARKAARYVVGLIPSFG